MSPAFRKIPALFAGYVATQVPLVAADEGEKLFALHVKGIIEETCIACHSPAKEHKLKGGLDLSSRETILLGGDSGDVLVVGNAADSLLYTATTWMDEDYEMPPKEADRLSEEEQGYLRDWINAGAPWPDPCHVQSVTTTNVIRFRRGTITA